MMLRCSRSAWRKRTPLMIAVEIGHARLLLRLGEVITKAYAQTCQVR